MHRKFTPLRIVNKGLHAIPVYIYLLLLACTSTFLFISLLVLIQ